MRYVVTKYQVDDLKLFQPAGDFGRWMQRIEFEAQSEAQRTVPHGSDSGRVNKTSGYPVGSLAASITCDHDRIMPRLFEMVLAANIYYATWVHEGTKTIVARGKGGQFAAAGPGEGMYLPGNPGWGPARWRQRVRGQQGNPFLVRAMENVGHGHSAIKVWRG